jgi:hypothetical protein
MAQAGYTPIQLYYSTTAAAVPVNTNLVSGELALNIQDEKLYFKNAAGTVKLLAGATSGPAGGSNTQVQFNSSGALAGSANLTFSGTTLTLQNGYYEAYDPVDTTSAGYGMRFYTNGGGTKTENGRLVVSQSGTGSALSSMIFQTNSGSSLAEQMRLTSTGLGIGTSSPASALDVRAANAGGGGGIRLTSTTGTNGVNIKLNNSAGNFYFGIDTSGGGTFGTSNAAALWYDAAQPLIFGTNNVKQMTLDSAGNLGLGVTPSAWFSGVKVVQFGTAGAVWSSNDRANLTANLYLDSATAFRYINDGYALRYAQEVGAHAWYTAPSGTAGNAITFTQAMTLDASGNLGIGVTDPASYSAKLNVAGNISASAGNNLRVWEPANTTYVQMNSPSSRVIRWINDATTEYMRLSSSGGLSVGTTSDPGAGAIYATGNITAFFSDKRLKTVSGKIENALDKVAKLSGVYYTFNDTAKSFGYDSDEEQVGVIAQEVEAVLPQIVKAAPFDLDENNNSKSGENYKTVQYDKLVPLLIEAINELQAKVKALESK